jgi:hypothetical protein
MPFKMKDKATYILLIFMGAIMFFGAILALIRVGLDLQFLIIALVGAIFFFGGIWGYIDKTPLWETKT